MAVAIRAVSVVIVVVCIVSSTPSANVFIVSMLCEASMLVRGIVCIAVTRSVSVAMSVTSVAVIRVAMAIAAFAWVVMP